MKLGRESLVLVVAPAVFLGATYVLLFCAERPLDAEAPRFDQQDPGHSLALAGDTGLRTRQAEIDFEAQGTAVSGRASGHPATPSIRTQPFRRREAVSGGPPERPEAEDKRGEARDPSRRSPVKGRVLGPDRQPIKGAQVRVTESPNLTAGMDKRLIGGKAETYVVALSEAGRFEFERAHGMIYEITVEAPDLAPLVVEAVGASRFLEIVLQAPGVVTGRVYDASNGSGLAGAEVTLTAYGIAQRSTTTSTSGGYVFHAVPPGPVVIEASHGEYVTSRRRVGVLLSGGLLDLQVPLDAGIVQQVQVVAGEEEQAVAGVKVEIEDLVSRISVFTGTTNGEGILKANNLQENRDYVARVWDSSGTHGAAAWTFHTGADGPSPTLRIVLEQGRVVSADVVDALSSLALPGAEVYMSASMNGFVVLTETLITGPHGRVEFPGLDARSQISLQAYLPGYAVTTLGPESLQSELPSGQFTLLMQGGIPLAGFVTEPGGQVVSGVLIRISPAAATKPGLSDLFTWTDEVGRFTFGGLPPGELMVVTLVGGYDSIEVPILLVAGEEPPVLHLVVQALSTNQ